MKLAELRNLCALLLIGALLTGCTLASELASVGDEGNQAVPGNAPAGESARVVYVIDGDTVEVEMGGARYRVRYVGVNTPESDEPCYADATRANRAWVDGQNVVLVRDRSETDRYDRLLRYIYLTDGTSINERLVREGWAEAVEYPPDTLYTAQFREIEREASRAGRGCHPTGIFDDGTQTR
ncbi:MAG: thermonuclease family protein [Chloroflexota bacterium]|nr:thermonuclease family protein [Chloroflexota bacterium]